MKRFKKVLVIIVSILLTAIVLFFLAAWLHPTLRYYTDGPPITTIESDYGFTFELPSRWAVWEGQSAIRDAIEYDGTVFFTRTASTMKSEEIQSWNGIDPVDQKEFVEVLENWNPATSQWFTFTNSYVDVQSLDPKKQIIYLGRIDDSDVNKSPPYNIVTAFMFPDKDLSFDKTPTTTEKFETRLVSVDNRDAQFYRLKHFSDVYDSVGLRIPLSRSTSTGYVAIFKEFLKDDDSAQQWMVDFAKGFRLK